MARALLITNPVAARTSPRTHAAVADRLRRGGWHLEVARTTAHGSARALAEEAVRADAEAVFVFGGDGTTMQAAASLVDTEVRLGIIPGGTGNLLAGNLRIPRSPDRAVDAVLGGRIRRVDLGRVDRADGPHYFAVAAGAGLDARVMGETSTGSKRRWGMAAYIATAIRRIPDIRLDPFRVTVDGALLETGATLVLVANCGEVFPPHLALGPGIRLDDGLLDAIVVRAEGLPDALRVLWHLARGHREPADVGTRLTYLRGQEIRVESDLLQPVELDGDALGTTPFTATVRAGALAVFAP